MVQGAGPGVLNLIHRVPMDDTAIAELSSATPLVMGRVREGMEETLGIACALARGALPCPVLTG